MLAKDNARISRQIQNEWPVTDQIIRKFAKKTLHIRGKLSFHSLFFLRTRYISEIMIKTADSTVLIRARC